MSVHLKPGDGYLHFKGGCYVIVSEAFPTANLGHKSVTGLFGIAKDEATLKNYVVFQHANGRVCVFSSDHSIWDALVVYKSVATGDMWLRTKQNFLESVPGGLRFRLAPTNTG